MKCFAVCLISLLVSASTASADEPTVSGQVRLVDGSAVAGAQVMLFDLEDLRRGAVARATPMGPGSLRCRWRASTSSAHSWVGRVCRRDLRWGRIIRIGLILRR